MGGVKFDPQKIHPLPNFALSARDFTPSPRAPRKGWEFFASGREAFFRIFARMKKSGFAGKLFLPRYFCPEAARAAGEICETEFFEDLPSEKSPRFETLRARAGDAVMAVNFFGLRDMGVWSEWKLRNPGAVLVQNSSHAPFSPRAQGTDFAFGSLRKWLPLPDGGFAEAENPSEIFARPASSMPDFSADFLAASAARSRGSGWEEFAENLFYAAEAKISARKKPGRMGAYSFETLARLDIEKLARRRFAAIRAFAYAARGNGFFEELTFAGGRAPDIFSACCPVLKFRDPRVRDAVYAKLREKKMFAPIYWGGFGEAGSPAARAESATLMCVPPHFADSEEEAEGFCEFIIGLCAGA